MTRTLTPVGVREAKNRFSELAEEVNRRSTPLQVLKNGKPWVTIVPADAASMARVERLRKLKDLTRAIEQNAGEEPAWDESIPDKELLAQERVRRFG